MAKRPPVTTATTSPVRPAEGTTRPRRLTLVWSGGGAPVRFMVPPGSGRRLVLGREPTGGGFDVPTDTEMSRNHVELTHIPEFDVLRLSDLNSKNGTFLNGKRVDSDYVRGGSVIRAGTSLFVLSELDRGAERVPGLEDVESPETADPKVSLARAYVELLAGKAAKSQSPVLIHGPTGSGKENLARRIHEQSGRKGPLVTLNAATLPSELVASELFGHVRGAFSNAAEARKGLFAEAHGGTLFLDEIAELPLEQQPALLRALQERKIRPVGSDREIDVDVRVIAATHQDLEALEKGGRFRADLLARIAVLRLDLPGLNQRREEILPLFRHFLLPSKPQFDIDAAEALLLYEWPKNVRELQQAAESIRVFLGEVDRVILSMLPLAVRRAAVGTSDGLASTDAAPTKEDLEEALRRLRGNVAALAKELGQHRNQLYRWFQLHGIDPVNFRDQ